MDFSFLSCLIDFSFISQIEFSHAHKIPHAETRIPQEIYTPTFNKEMTIAQRKQAIKQSSDMAIASARNEASTRWSRALMADLVSSKKVSLNISGRKVSNKIITCSKRIPRSSRCRRSVVGSSDKASRIARQLVKKRTRVLKRLVPGGERMDEISLIKETLDYIASLQVQVEVMRNVLAVAELMLQGRS